MAASLNMNYPEAAEPGINDYAKLNRLWEIIERSRVPFKLKEAGYRIINLSLFDLNDCPQFYKYTFGYNTLTETIVNESFAGGVKKLLPDSRREERQSADSFRLAPDCCNGQRSEGAAFHLRPCDDAASAFFTTGMATW